MPLFSFAALRHWFGLPAAPTVARYSYGAHPNKKKRQPTLDGLTAAGSVRLYRCSIAYAAVALDIGGVAAKFL